MLVRDAVENGNDQRRMGCGAPEACESAALGVSGAVVSFSAGQKLAWMVGNGTKVDIKFSTKLQGEHLVGLDHFGRLREVGRVPPSGVESVHSWHFITLEAHYYDHQKDVASLLDSHDVVPVIGGRGDASVLAGGAGLTGKGTFPDARAMALYDTMQLHVKLECPADAEKSCGAWDYAVDLSHCGEKAANDGLSGECDAELGRFVTAYGRPGEWVVDATALLPLLRRGGEQTFRLAQPEWSGQRYRPTVNILLSSSGEGAVPVSSAFLFAGGDFGLGYNDLASHAPLRISIPHAAKVRARPAPRRCPSLQALPCQEMQQRRGSI